MAEKRIFISYRRSDTSGHAGRLNDYLSDYFGIKRVFFDVDTIEPGSNFEQRIKSELDNSASVLVLIGNQWLETRDKAGNRRIDDPHDYVHIEIQTALSKRIPVIPILLQGVNMPSIDVLPESICDLSMQNAIRLNDDHWKSDCNLLAAVLKNNLNVSRSLKEQKIRKYTIIVITLMTLVGMSAVLSQLLSTSAVSRNYPLIALGSVIFTIGGAAVNVALITYLLGTIKRELDHLSWIIISLTIVSVVVITLGTTLGSSLLIWVVPIVLFEAGLLNLVTPDE